MTLTEIIAEVYTLTNRPDLVSQTLAAVRSATLKAHHTDYYYKDIYEAPIAFSSAEYIQSLEYQSLIPRWRALKYLRKLDVSSTPNVPGTFFELITPEAVLDSYGITRENVCYVAGSYVQIRSNTEFQYCLMGCYVNPQVGTTNASYISWIAIDAPWAIIFEAAGTVFRMIGKNDEWGAFASMAQQQYAELKINFVVAGGY